MPDSRPRRSTARDRRLSHTPRSCRSHWCGRPHNHWWQSSRRTHSYVPRRRRSPLSCRRRHFRVGHRWHQPSSHRRHVFVLHAIAIHLRAAAVRIAVLKAGSALSRPTSAERIGVCPAKGRCAHANSFGGSGSGERGSGFEHSNAYGGSTKMDSNGMQHENAYGGGTTADANGVQHENAYGGSRKPTPTARNIRMRTARRLPPMVMGPTTPMATARPRCMAQPPITRRTTARPLSGLPSADHRELLQLRL